MKTLFRILIYGVAAAAMTGLGLTGCRSVPELTPTGAQSLLQAHYDNQPPSGVTIMVGKRGLQQGLTAGYWKLTKVYPNQRWADYTLTPEGKQVLKLAKGGDVIEWRPQQDGEYQFLVVTAAANPMRVKDVQQPEDVILPDAKHAKTVGFNESVNLEGVPQPLQDIAHNPGNRLSQKKQADLSYENGGWKLHGVL